MQSFTEMTLLWKKCEYERIPERLITTFEGCCIPYVDI